DCCFIQFYLERAATAFLRSVAPGVTDQDLTHRTSSHGEEVRAALPVWIGLVGQTQISLVDQRCRLQRVVRTLSFHVMMSETSEFFIDQRGQFREGGIIALTPMCQELGHSLLRDRRRIHNLLFIRYHSKKVSARGSVSEK